MEKVTQDSVTTCPHCPRRWVAVLTDCLPASNSDMAAVLREASTVRILLKVVVATVTFLTFYYSTTIAMSIMYALDAAMLKF